MYCIKRILMMFFVVGLHGYGAWLHEDVQSECTNRFEFRNALKKHFASCKQLISSVPICGKNITISYANHPPYVFQSGNGSISGILPGKNFSFKIILALGYRRVF